jgi:adenosylcobyric acid synthase
LRHVARTRGIDWVPGEEPFAAARETRLDALGDLVAENVDRDALLRLIDDGQPSGLPVISGKLVSLPAGQQRAENGGASRAQISPSANGENGPSPHAVGAAVRATTRTGKADG